MLANPLALSELVARLRWFVALRWIAAAGIAATALALHYVIGVTLPVLPLLLIATAVAGVNLLYWIQLRLVDRARVGAAEAARSANAQIAVDLVLLTLLLHFVGGAENPFYLYYVFHIIIASILLSARATYLQATLAVVLFGGLAILELSGAIPHVAIGALGVSGAYAHAGYLLAVLAAFTSTLYLAAYMATTIVGRLREREQEVLVLRDTLQAEQDRLRDAYRQLQETEQVKSQYMRKVGHQLRAPLAAMQTLLSALLEGLAGPISTEGREMLERAVARSKQMLALVNDLLALSRAREAHISTVARPVQVGDVAKQVAGLFAAQARAKGIALETEIPPLPPLQGDAAGIEDLLLNLVSNAIEYTPSGGRVRVALALEGEQIVISVQDTGIGIAAEELPHLYEEFFRSERARELAPGGTGLGMAIVRAVVAAHGGEIAVESAPGKGTTFTVRLPLVSKRAEARSGSGAPGNGPAAAELPFGPLQRLIE